MTQPRYFLSDKLFKQQADLCCI